MSFFSLFLNVQQISITSYSYPFQFDTIFAQILSASHFIAAKLHWLLLSDRRRHDWSFLDWRLKEMISWSLVYGLYLLLSLSPPRYGPETSSDIDRKYFIQKMKNIWSIVRKGVVAVALVSLMQCMMDVIEEVQKCVYRRWRKEPDSGSGSGEI